MKKIKVILIVSAFLWILGKYVGVGGSVESLYGTYTGTDKHGNKIQIELSEESDNEWRKYGKDYSDNLVYTDSYGILRKSDYQTVQWTWNLNDGYIKVYRNFNQNESYVIDLENEKIYESWGQYLDDRNGIPYSFSN